MFLNLIYYTFTKFTYTYIHKYNTGLLIILMIKNYAIGPPHLQTRAKIMSNGTDDHKNCCYLRPSWVYQCNPRMKVLHLKHDSNNTRFECQFERGDYFLASTAKPTSVFIYERKFLKFNRYKKVLELFFFNVCSLFSTVKLYSQSTFFSSFHFL